METAISANAASPLMVSIGDAVSLPSAKSPDTGQMRSSSPFTPNSFPSHKSSSLMSTSSPPAASTAGSPLLGQNETHLSPSKEPSVIIGDAQPTPTSATLLATENADSMASSLSDVETFNGKIVYNPDGSAYIIEGPDSDGSEVEAEISQEGSIIDARGLSPHYGSISFPQIVSAFHISRSSPAENLYSALCGQVLPASSPSTVGTSGSKANEVPVMHSYRVFSLRNNCKTTTDREAAAGEDENGTLADDQQEGQEKVEEEEEKEEEEEAKLSATNCSTVPVKPILMCFICKLSFGYSKSFVAHAVGEHHLSLNEEETRVLSAKNTSAIIQGVGKEKEPLLSFLKPNSSPAPFPAPSQQQQMEVQRLLAVQMAAVASALRSSSSLVSPPTASTSALPPVASTSSDGSGLPALLGSPNSLTPCNAAESLSQATTPGGAESQASNGGDLLLVPPSVDTSSDSHSNLLLSRSSELPLDMSSPDALASAASGKQPSPPPQSESTSQFASELADLANLEKFAKAAAAAAQQQMDLQSIAAAMAAAVAASSSSSSSNNNNSSSTGQLRTPSPGNKGSPKSPVSASQSALLSALPSVSSANSPFSAAINSAAVSLMNSGDTKGAMSIFSTAADSETTNLLATTIANHAARSTLTTGSHPPLLMQHSRNSCKTLKCPKCNWHYKYQETLEIHMKEKHPENEMNCIYCLTNQPHPRLARGETYTCGYKPYRCDVCNYSTTTKGNLSIHMQSDKHINNVQELQNGNIPATAEHLLQSQALAAAVAQCSAAAAAANGTPSQSTGSGSTPSAVATSVGSGNMSGGGSTSVSPVSTPSSVNLAAMAVAAAAQQDAKMQKMNSPQVSTPPTATTPSPSSSSQTNSSGGKQKATWRCDVCNYETNVARNLRIHMTSEKHTHNIMVLRQNVNQMQQISALQQAGILSPEQLLQFNPGLLAAAAAAAMNAPGQVANVGPENGSPSLQPEAALADMAYNHALLMMASQQHQQRAMAAIIQQQQQQQQQMSLSEAKSPLPVSMIIANGSQPTFDMEHPDPSLSAASNVAPIDDSCRMFHCCVCATFTSDSIEVLNQHIQCDRTRTRENEVLEFAGNSNICKLCSYKTNLKANFQLHCKTDKHIQRLQHVNHIKEGGLQAEWKLKFVNVSNPVQVRCNLCDYYTNSIHKLQLHTANPRHDARARIFSHLQTSSEMTIGTANKYYMCTLCNSATRTKFALLQHINSVKHVRNDSLHQLKQQQTGVVGVRDSEEEIREMFIVKELLPGEKVAFEHDEDVLSGLGSPPLSGVTLESADPALLKNALMDPATTAQLEVKLGLVDHSDQLQQQQQQSSPITCPVCPFSSSSEMRLQMHILTSHSHQSTSTGSDQASGLHSAPSINCPLCQEAFQEKSRLENHLVRIHNVNEEGFQKLMLLVDTTELDKFLAAKQQQQAKALLIDNSRRLASQADDDDDDGRRSECSGDSSSKLAEDELIEAGKFLAGGNANAAFFEYLLCPSCNQMHLNLEDLFTHMNSEGHIKPILGGQYQCWRSGCGQTFKSVTATQQHFKEQHFLKCIKLANSSANLASSAPVSDRHVYKYRCSQCSLAFKTYEKLELHMQYHLIRAATQCVICSRNFRSVEALQKHVETSHADMNEEELEQYKASLVSNQLLFAFGRNGGILDPSTTQLLKKESTRNDGADDEQMDTEDDAILDSCQATDDNSQPMDEFNSSAENTVNCAMNGNATENSFEDYLNSQSLAEDNYNDPNRKFKCHRCKVAFTRQSYLTSHNKTLLHRKGEKMSYPMEKYLDPNRPFKCEICKESFTQKNILLVHYNSVSHLHKLKQSMKESSAAVAAAASRGEPSDDQAEGGEGRTFKCNLCKVEYHQAAAFNSHLQSMAHKSRDSKFQELAITGQLDLSLPLIEHPETMEANNNNPCKANANELPSSGSAKHQPHHHQQQQHQLQLQQVNTPSGSPSPSKLQADMLANLSEQQQQALALQQAFNFAIAAGAQSSGQSQLLQLAGQSPFTCAKCGAAFISQEAQLQHQQLCGLFGNVQSIQANSSSANNNNGNNLPSAGNSQLQQQQQARQFKLANLQSAQPLCKSKPQLYKTLLETWGFEIVMQFNESNQKKKKLSTDAKPETEQPEEGSSGETGETAEAPLEKEANAAPENEPTDDAVPEINKCQCDICSKEFSSIWVLKAHREEIHKDVLPLDVVESFADEYRTEYERKFSNGAEDSEATENGGAVENGSASNHCSAESASGAHHTSQISPSEGNCDENTSPTAEQTASTLQQLAVGNGNVNSGTPPEMANFGQFGLPANASAAEIAAANQMAAAQLQFGQLLMSMGLAGMAGMPMPSGMNMPFAAAAAMGIPPQLIPMMMADPMMAAAAAFNNPALAAAAAAQMNAAVHQGQQQQQQQQQQSASGVPPPGACSSPAPNSALSGPVTPVTPVSQMSSQAAAVAAAAAAQQKRARTRISDDQLKVLRQYFDINNSPTEEQLIEMSQKSGLPMKVIKHWFRNTLFKERQRNKDSPYNFNNPPSTYLNIDEYEKTGEAKVFNIDDIKKEESSCTTTTIATATAETEQKETSVASIMKPKEKPAESESESESAGYLKNCSNEFKSSSSTKDTDYATSDDEEVKRSREPREHISLNTNSNSVDLSLNNLQKQQHAHLQSQLQLQKQAEFDHLRESMSLSVHSPQHSESSMSSNSESTSATTTTTTTSSLFAGLSNFGPGLAGAPNMASSPLQFAIDAAQRSQLAAAAAAAVSPGMLNNAGHVSSHSSSGKRANRTRFTDYQIKVLQEFFESNAYPKDDDLEYLSKLLNLSPRVIVVWFQNARQKARKNYENQPASEPIETDDGTGRFQRTPGLNYQCKKCLQVFQRYYELIKHQKSSCFKDENPLAAQIRMAAERTNPTSPITAPRDTTTPIDCSRSATATPEKVTPLNMMASPGSVSTASPATSSTSSNHKSSPNVAENQPKFPCDKCTVVLKSYDQWKEHQIVHLVQQNTSLFNPSSSNPFSGLMGQFEGAQQSVSTHLPNSPQPMTISPSANIFSSGVKRKLTTTTDDEDDESHDSMSGNGGSNSGDQATRDKRLRTTILPEQLDYLYQKYQVESNPSRKMLESIAKEVGLKKRVVQVWFQNTRARERKGQFRAHQQVIHKRCPFCRALFKARSALESHLATRHADQYTKGDINIDSLPDGDPSEDGDNSVPESMDPRNSMDSNMADMVRQYYASCMGDLNMQGKDGGGCLSAELALKMKVLEHAVTQQQQQQQQQNSAFAAINSSSAIDFDQTPHPLQSTSTATTSTATATTPSSAVSSFFASIRNNSNGGGGGLGEDEGFDDSRSEEFDSEAEEEIDFDYTPNSNPSSPSAANPFGSSHSAHCSNSGNSHRGVVNSNSKRFRTQMTTVMLKAMKSIFADYKTPTMAECEALGREIGLAKRVVQVWFQNARAKEKKARLQFAKAFGRDLDLNTPAIEECKICNVKYSKHAPNAMQEHLFSSAHIAKLKIQIDNLKKNIDGQEENSIDFPVASGHPVPFSMLVNPHSTNNIFTGNGDPKKAATLVQQLQLIHGLAAASQNTGLTMNFNDLLNGVNDANGDAISKKSLEQVEQNESNFNFSSEQHEGEPNSFSSFMFSAER